MSGLAEPSYSRRLGNLLRTLLMLKVAIFSVFVSAGCRAADRFRAKAQSNSFSTLRRLLPTLWLAFFTCFLDEPVFLDRTE